MADDELADLNVAKTAATSTPMIAEENIDQRASELKNIEDALLQKMRAKPPEQAHEAPATLKQTSFAGSNTLRQPDLDTAQDKAERVAPERRTTHSVPVDHASAKVSADQRLAIAEIQVTILSRELEVSRRGLRSAERRIEELSELVKGRPRSSRSDSSDFAYGSDHEARRSIRSGHTVPLLEESEDAGEAGPAIRPHSSMVASIATDKTAVRTGPGKGESVLFVLSEGSEVTIDRRSGEWYRVVANSGVRGWIFGQALVFDSGISPSSAVRIRAVRNRYEPTNIKY
jgi:hypothetical protein